MSSSASHSPSARACSLPISAARSASLRVIPRRAALGKLGDAYSTCSNLIESRIDCTSAIGDRGTVGCIDEEQQRLARDADDVEAGRVVGKEHVRAPDLSCPVPAEQCAEP